MASLTSAHVSEFTRNGKSSNIIVGIHRCAGKILATQQINKKTVLISFLAELYIPTWAENLPVWRMVKRTVGLGAVGVESTRLFGLALRMAEHAVGSCAARSKLAFCGGRSQCSTVLHSISCAVGGRSHRLQKSLSRSSSHLFSCWFSQRVDIVAGIGRAWTVGEQRAELLRMPVLAQVALGAVGPELAAGWLHIIVVLSFVARLTVIRCVG